MSYKCLILITLHRLYIVKQVHKSGNCKAHNLGPQSKANAQYKKCIILKDLLLVHCFCGAKVRAKKVPHIHNSHPITNKYTYNSPLTANALFYMYFRIMFVFSATPHTLLQHVLLTLRLFPSKGKEPLTSVYRMTPKLQTSTSGPSYFFPWKSSGAAYGGLPQNVSSLLPGVNSLLKPKSAILMFILASSRRFSA